MPRTDPYIVQLTETEREKLAVRAPAVYVTISRGPSIFAGSDAIFSKYAF